MARFLRYHLFAIFVVLLSTRFFVQSLPTSVLVEEKQQQNEQTNSLELNKETQTASKSPSTAEHGNTITVDNAQPKLHAQKRGVKQNFYEPNIPSDFLLNNNVPSGIWDDGEETSPYSEFQDEDYSPIYSTQYATHHQRPYDNFQRVMSTDNLYDEPLALPVKYKYPTRFFDERRKRGVNKHIMRLKRDSTKLNSADMLALLSFLEAKQRDRYDNANDELKPFEYQKPIYAPYANFDNTNNDVDNNAEWWNEDIEPSVQFYGNAHGHNDEIQRKHFPSAALPPKRFMISKKKRSLNHAIDEQTKNEQKKSYFGFNRRSVQAANA